MDPDKDDVSSSIMDSLDKGAGWGAGDGPMSNMSAKGVTGNQLPNNMEIGGRSGEGRNGKSDGEMVGNTAVGKGGNETPTRMTSTPFENGSVADQSHDTKGGATGGGKLAGFGQDGLRGPMPPEVQQRVRMLAQQQAQLRQQAESLALQLRKERRPTGDLESAVAAMKKVEHARRTRRTGLAWCRVIIRRSMRWPRLTPPTRASGSAASRRTICPHRAAGCQRHAGRAGASGLRGNDGRLLPVARRLGERSRGMRRPTPAPSSPTK